MVPRHFDIDTNLTELRRGAVGGDSRFEGLLGHDGEGRERVEGVEGVPFALLGPHDRPAERVAVARQARPVARCGTERGPMKLYDAERTANQIARHKADDQ